RGPQAVLDGNGAARAAAPVTHREIGMRGGGLRQTGLVSRAHAVGHLEGSVTRPAVIFTKIDVPPRTKVSPYRYIDHEVPTHP
ncbi:MAG TPA: hypothetical protein VGS06_28605, partial [Streptosporangiaceae bacterium]|nr:hypothetical protein [Streptosporangiaceae bacterium]